MPNQYEDDDDNEYEFDSEGPANLRKALKKAERQRKELEDQLSNLKSNLRQRSVKDVLEAKGVNPKIAAFIPADADSPEAIATWLDEYADIFGGSVAKTSEPELSEDDRMSQRMDNSVSTASTPGRDEDLMTRLANVSSKEELDQLVFGKTMGR